MGYFVRIEDATGTRRRLLEGGRDLLLCLKSYYAFLELRDRKREAAKALEGLLASLAKDLARLERLLPEESLKEVEQYLPKRPKKAAKKSGKAPKREKEEEAPPTDMERLRHALANIEERLERL